MAEDMNLGDVMGGEVSQNALGETETKMTKPKSKEGELERMEIERADNGGFIVREYFKGNRGMFQPGGGSKTHAVADIKELDSLIDECWGMSDAYDQEAPGGSDTGTSGDSGTGAMDAGASGEGDN